MCPLIKGSNELPLSYMYVGVKRESSSIYNSYIQVYYKMITVLPSMYLHRRLWSLNPTQPVSWAEDCTHSLLYRKFHSANDSNTFHLQSIFLSLEFQSQDLSCVPTVVILLPSGVTIGFEQTSYIVNEGDGVVTVMVVIFSGMLDQDIDVRLFTTDDSALCQSAQP